jgi:hypothetical protein
MMRWLLLGVLLAGCGGDDDGGTCALRNGTYVVQYLARSGNCGNAEFVFTINDQQGGSIEPCTGSNQVSADNCEVTYDTLCPAANGGSQAENGKTSWSKDGSRGTGVADYTLFNSRGQVLCHSTYDLVFQRR